MFSLLVTVLFLAPSVSSAPTVSCSQKTGQASVVAQAGPAVQELLELAQHELNIVELLRQDVRDHHEELERTCDKQKGQEGKER